MPPVINPHQGKRRESLSEGALCMVFVDSDRQAKVVLRYLFHEFPVKVTIFNYAELLEGTYWAENVTERQRIMNEYLKKFIIVPFATPNAHEFARIAAELENKREIIGVMDLLIASIIIGQAEEIYTRNSDHFIRIPDLKVTNWMEFSVPS